LNKKGVEKYTDFIKNIFLQFSCECNFEPKERDIGMAVLAYFSYGILVFSLKNCSITILEILQYTVFAILD
jgi:hypothetical protein